MWWWLVSNWLPLRGTLKFQMFLIHSTNWHFFVDRKKLCCDKFVLCGRRETSSGVRQPIRAQYETNWPITGTRGKPEAGWRKSIKPTFGAQLSRSEASVQVMWLLLANQRPVSSSTCGLYRALGPVAACVFVSHSAAENVWLISSRITQDQDHPGSGCRVWRRVAAASLWRRGPGPSPSWVWWVSWGMSPSSELCCQVYSVLGLLMVGTFNLEKDRLLDRQVGGWPGPSNGNPSFHGVVWSWLFNLWPLIGLSF